MRRPLIALVTVLAVAGCSQSTLPEDDQAFCAEQEDELGPALDAMQEIVDGDRHWSSDGEPFAVREVYIDPAQNFIRAFEPQDQDLADRVEAVDSALFYVGSDLLVTPEDAFADDAASSRDGIQAIEDLQAFCDDKG